MPTTYMYFDLFYREQSKKRICKSSFVLMIRSVEWKLTSFKNYNSSVNMK